MYQVVGLWKILTSFALVAALLALALAQIRSPIQIGEIWRLGSFAVSLTGALMLALGQTPLFPLLCRLPVVRSVFPPIDGEWIGRLNSNFPQIAKAFRLTSNTGPVVAKFTIKARLFNVRISSVSVSPRPGYMRSDTTAFRISKSAHTDRIVVHYVYDAFVGEPDQSDVDSFYGAARLVLLDEGSELSLEGTYWTDRNWQKGYNTAGSIKLTRQ